MKRILYLLCLIALLSGCWLAEPQYVSLDPKDPVVAEIVTKADGDQKILRQEIEKYLGSQVDAVRELDGKLTAVLTTPASEMAEDAATGFVDSILENPTPAGVVAGLMAALGAALGVYKERKKYRTQNSNGAAKTKTKK